MSTSFRSQNTVLQISLLRDVFIALWGWAFLFMFILLDKYMYSVLHAVAISTGKEISIIVRGGCDCASCETQIFCCCFMPVCVTN